MKMRLILTAALIIAVLAAAVPTLAQDDLPTVKVALILPGRAMTSRGTRRRSMA